LSSSTSVISPEFGVQPCDIPISHRSRREMYMVHRETQRHPMKVV
jgi:hypothetical protein